MTIAKHVATTIFTVLVFIFFSELLSTKFSISNFFKGTPKPTVREYLLPSYEKLHSACYIFDRQIKVYNDAVILGDSYIITDAKRYAKKITRSIQYIISLKNLPALKRADLQDLLQYYIAYTSTAGETYLSMTKSEFEETTNEQLDNIAAELATKQLTIKKKLKKLSDSFYEELEKDIATINS